MPKRRTIAKAYEGLVDAASQVSRDLQLLIDEKNASLQREAPKLSREAIHDRRKEIDRLDLTRQTLANELDQRTPNAPYLRYLLDGIAIFGSIASIATAAPALVDDETPATIREQELCASILDHIETTNRQADELKAEIEPQDEPANHSGQDEDQEGEQATDEGSAQALAQLFTDFDELDSDQRSQFIDDLNQAQRRQLFDAITSPHRHQLVGPFTPGQRLFDAINPFQRFQPFYDLTQDQQNTLFGALDPFQRVQLLKNPDQDHRPQFLKDLNERHRVALTS